MIDLINAYIEWAWIIPVSLATAWSMIFGD
jgi:hypothetical protein